MGIYWADSQNHQVVAKVEVSGQVPANLVEVIDEEQENQPGMLFFDGDEVSLIPPKPSNGNYEWNFNEMNWVKVIEVQPQPVPGWKAFRDAMLNDIDYDKATDQMMTASAKSLMRLENALTTEPQDVTMIISLWNSLVSKILIKPTTGAIAAWNQYATSNRIPLEFKSGGGVSKRNS